MEIIHNPKTWGLSMKEFNRLGWGSAFAKFVVPHSITKRFRKTFYYDSNKQEVPAGTAGATAISVFDSEGFFYEIATTYVNALVSTREIFSQTPFSFLEGGMELNADGTVKTQPILGSTQDLLRKAMFATIEFALANKQTWQNVNGSSLNLPNYSLDVNATGWMFTDDMFDMKAKNFINNSGIDDYEWVTEDALFTYDKVGNIKIIGKANVDAIPILAEV